MPKSKTRGDSGVYAIVDDDGGMYIGSTVNLKHRWHVHRYQLKNEIHHSRTLQSVWNKSGEDGLSFKVLELCDEHNLLATEQKFIDSMKPTHNIYMTAGSPAGMKVSEETKAKLSMALKGRQISEETLKKRSAALKGRTFSPEHREKLSLSYPKCMAVRCKETNQVFRSTQAAVKWLKESGRPTASGSMVIKVCKGKMKAAYGYTWEYMGVSDAGK